MLGDLWVGGGGHKRERERGGRGEAQDTPV